MLSLANDEDVSVMEELIVLDDVIEEGVLETKLDEDWLLTLVMELEEIKLSLAELMISEDVTNEEEAVTLLDVGGVYVDHEPVDFPSPLSQAVKVNKF